MSDVPTRLLRDALRRAAAEPSSNCLDAAALAAWADGSLGSRERAGIESHAASCARCQALVAAIAKTTPPASPPRGWRRSTFAWLVPIGAAAAALVLWIAAPAPRVGRLAPAPLTMRESQAGQTPPPALAAPAAASAPRATGAP